MCSLCIGLGLLSQNYWCHVTSTLYKPDTSLRRTVGVGPDGVCRCLREFTVMLTSLLPFLPRLVPLIYIIYMLEVFPAHKHYFIYRMAMNMKCCMLFHRRRCREGQEAVAPKQKFRGLSPPSFCAKNISAQHKIGLTKYSASGFLFWNFLFVA